MFIPLRRCDACLCRVVHENQEELESHVYKTRIDQLGRPKSDKTKHDVSLSPHTSDRHVAAADRSLSSPSCFLHP